MSDEHDRWEDGLVERRSPREHHCEWRLIAETQDAQYSRVAALIDAAREAGWAMMEVVDGIAWERREQFSDIAARLAKGVESVVSPGLPVGEGQGAVWHRADSAGQVLLYTLRQDGWRKGEPIMVNDIEVRIQASNGAAVDLEAVVDAVWFGLQAAQQEQANDRR